LIRDEWIKACTYDTVWTSIWQRCRDSFRTLLGRSTVEHPESDQHANDRDMQRPVS
jgi:hypothetical protein